MDNFSGKALSLSPRGLVRARAAGLIPHLIDRLCAAGSGSGSGSGASKSSNLASDFSSDIFSDATLLESVLKDVDAGLEFAVRGGHAPLSKLLTRALSKGGDGDPLLADALEPLARSASLAMRALPVGWPSGFPAPACADALETATALPLFFDFSSFLLAPAVDADMLPNRFRRHSSSSGEGGDVDVSVLGAPLRIQLRLVSPLRARQTSQADVGFALWPAALPFARWVVAHRASLLGGGARVLEIGAGVGLTGIAAALAAPKGSPSVWLTDFNPRVLDNLTRNAALNDPSLHSPVLHNLHHGLSRDHPHPDPDPDADLAAFASFYEAPRFRTARDDWTLYKDNNEEGASADDTSTASASADDASSASASASASLAAWEPTLPLRVLFDVILGSDMICSAGDASGVAALIAARLAPNGIAILMLPPTDVRWGVDTFPSAAGAAGLVFEVRPLAAAFLAASFEGDAASAAVEADMTTASGYESRAQIYFVRRK